MTVTLNRLAGAVACAFAPVVLLSTEVLAAHGADGILRRTADAPEIDGPAGIAAVALVISAGLIAYRRFKK